MAPVVDAWLRTLRLSIVEDAPRDDPRPWVLVFFHGRQVPLLAWPRRRGTAVLVSRSGDGDVQAQVMARAAMRVVRGSTSRGGARGLLGLVRAMRAEALDAAFAIDGPRGPSGTIHPGAAACARLVGGVLVPLGSACAPSTTLHRSWDRFVVPWPFARAAVVVGAPLPADVAPERLRAALDEVDARAATNLAAVPGR